MFDLIEIPAGSFTMGAKSNQIEAVQGEGFLLGATVVTQKQWRWVTRNLPRVDLPLLVNPSYFKGDLLPVERVHWDDAIEFCARLSAYSGLTYRLPSEAEWEYACRAGTTTRFNTGGSLATQEANYRNSRPVPVRTYGPNQWGLYGMHGNVWEWCSDHLGATLNHRVIRGGSWHSSPKDCTSATRDFADRLTSSPKISFRLALDNPPR